MDGAYSYQCRHPGPGRIIIFAVPENQSLLFDLEILFATIPVVLLGKSAC
jgi:hypothetical protein